MINELRKIICKECNCSTPSVTQNSPSENPPSSEITQVMLVKTAEQTSRSHNCRCYSPGIATRNPFLNYLRDYRRTHCGVSVINIAVEGANEWNQMSDDEKYPYIQLAQRTPPRHKRSSPRK